MHLAEGVLSAPVLFAGTGLSILGIALGLKKLDSEQMPQVAVLTAAFFVAALVHIPIGPSSVHLVLHGLLGIILGWAALIRFWRFECFGGECIGVCRARTDLFLSI